MKKILGFALILVIAPHMAAADCKVSKAKYDALKDGMSYSQAVETLGCAGEEISSSNVAGYRTVMYNWYGSTWTGANMNAMFQNGKMVMKAQYGLK